VHGEAQNNVMPGQCRLVLDCRLIPGQTAADLSAKIKSLLAEVERAEKKAVRFSYQCLEAREPTFIAKEAEIVQVLDQAYRDVSGQAPVYGGVPGSTDGTILFSRAGVPIVTVGPGDIHIPHHIDEWLDLDELIEATRLYAVAAIRFLGPADC